ncbi:hypothetical protein V8C37DRAFT_383624 [Trichoderma ceciliae]
MSGPAQLCSCIRLSASVGKPTPFLPSLALFSWHADSQHGMANCDLIAWTYGCYALLVITITDTLRASPDPSFLCYCERRALTVGPVLSEPTSKKRPPAAQIETLGTYELLGVAKRSGHASVMVSIRIARIPYDGVIAG